jgi:RNA polymerase sigma-70 factor, ECF subfamily
VPAIIAPTHARGSVASHAHKPSRAEPQSLLERLRRREPAAFDTIYSSFRRYVMALAQHVLSNKWEAEEVTQDVFLALWLRPPELTNGLTSLAAWLATATKRQCWLRLRRAERRPMFEELTEDLCYSDLDLERVDENLLREKFVAALTQIGPPQREILMRVYYDDMEPAEVARHLSLPVITVRKSLLSATLRLRRRLALVSRPSCPHA